jgi:parallel beta-helix repeat protein
MTWLLLFVLAAGPFVSIETESASISGNVEVKTDSNASAGSYLAFGIPPPSGGGGGGSSGDAGLIRPVGPQALSCSSISGSVDISPGTNIQSIVDSKPAGTKYCLKVGVHKRQTIIPKGNDQIIGEKGAVLDGEKATVYAIRGGANNVTVRNLVIANYSPEKFKGMLEPEGGGLWNIENNEMRGSTAIGLSMGGSGWVVKDNYLHHNEQYGMSGASYPSSSGRNPLVENNEISYNRLNALIPGGSSGGTKWVRSTNLTLRHNWVHHNRGNGLWVDGNNKNVVIENNKLEFNDQKGISVEISCDTKVRNNYLRENGAEGVDWYKRSGILVNSSSNVEIYNNTFIDTGGVTAVDWGRISVNERCETTDPGEFQLLNMWVHDNYIESDRYFLSGVSGNGTPAARNNKFDRNTYVPKGLPEPRYMFGSEVTTAQWKAAGQDKNSTWR